MNLHNISRFFKINLDEDDEDDEETRKLDDKVEATLKLIARASATIPDEVNAWLAKVTQETRTQDEAKKVLEFLQLAYKELPNVSSILGNWTASLSSYAQFRALQKQERLTSRILKANQRLADATIILALATFALVFVTVWLHL